MFERGAAFLLVVAFVTSPVWATCGGGGGGGGGGMAGSGGGGGSNDPKPVVYHVPWKMPPKGADQKIATEGLVLYWMPASPKEYTVSPLRESRNLSLYASQCVTMQAADASLANYEKLVGGSPLPVVVLATPDGTPIKKVD